MSGMMLSQGYQGKEKESVRAEGVPNYPVWVYFNCRHGGRAALSHSTFNYSLAFYDCI
jgi:hypothetical protein